MCMFHGPSVFARGLATTRNVATHSDFSIVFRSFKWADKGPNANV